MELPTLDAVLSTFLASGATLVGATVGVALLVRREGDRRAQRWLGALLLVTAVTFANGLLCEVGACTVFPQLYFLPLDFSLAVGPLAYLYVRERVAPGLAPRDAIHAALPLAEVALWTAVGVRSVAFKGWFWMAVVEPWLGGVLSALFVASAGGYLVAAHRLARTPPGAAAWAEARARWLRRFVRTVGLLVAVLTAYVAADVLLGRVWGVNPYNWLWYAFPKHIAYAGVLAAFAWHGWEQMHPARWMPPPAEPAPVQPAPRAETYGLDADALAAEARRVRAFVDAGEPFRNPDLTLGLLADALGMSDKRLSYVLNAGLGTAYAPLVNGLRVDAARAALADPAQAHLSVLGIGFDAGFSSKATFYRAFKAATGKTPAEVRREARFADDAAPGTPARSPEDDLRPLAAVPDRP